MLYVTSIKVDGKEQLIGELLASFFASDAQLHMDVVKEGGTVEVRFCNRGGERLLVGLCILYAVSSGELLVWSSRSLNGYLEISGGTSGVIIAESLPRCRLRRWVISCE
jgi:hypothetical protein